jgi:hypothetical protein
MKRSDFFIFSGSKEYKYSLISDKYEWQNTQILIYKNQQTSKWAPLELPNGGPLGSLKIYFGGLELGQENLTIWKPFAIFKATPKSIRFIVETPV